MQLRASIKSGTIVGTTALFLAISGMFNALAGPHIAGVSLSRIILVLMGLWAGLLMVRGPLDGQELSPPWQTALSGALAGIIAGLWVAALVLLASAIDVRFRSG